MKNIFTVYSEKNRKYSIRISLMCIVISNYCDFATAPTLSNANSPTPQTTIGATTSFTCSFGYKSSISPSNPYYSCQHSTSTTGTWTSSPAVTGSCERMRPLMFCLFDCVISCNLLYYNTDSSYEYVLEKFNMRILACVPE